MWPWSKIKSLKQEVIQIEARELAVATELVEAKRQRDQAVGAFETQKLLREQADRERDKCAQKYDDVTEFDLEVELSESTEGRDKVPCVRFVLREMGQKKILAVSDIDGEPTPEAMNETIRKISNGQIIRQIWKPKKEKK